MSLYMYLDTGGMFYLEYTWGRKAGGSRSHPCIHTGRGASTQTWTRSDKKLSTALWWVYSGKWPLRCWGRPVWYTSHQLKTQKNHVRADTEQKSVVSHDDNIESKMHSFSNSNLYIQSNTWILYHNVSVHWLTKSINIPCLPFFMQKGANSLSKKIYL